MNAISDKPEYTEEEIAALRQQVAQLIEGERLTQADCARQAGVAYGTFTGWYRGTYQGDNNKVAATVARWLRTREERARTSAILPTEPGFVHTEMTSRITSILQYAQIAPDIVVIAGDAGTSKTSSARHYADATPNVWLVTADPNCSSANAMLGEICAVIGVAERSAAKLGRAIGEHLRGKQALLIIDEAQHLGLPALEQLRSLHDKYGIGVGLIGNVSIYSRIDGGRTAQFAQLFSRVGMRLTKTRPSAGDVRQLLAAWGIDGDAEQAYLQAIAAKPGALRQMVKTIRLACVMAAGAGADAVTIEHLRSAYSRQSAEAAG
jgi:DNA transposition AAA+ family ATPase